MNRFSQAVRPTIESGEPWRPLQPTGLNAEPPSTRQRERSLQELAEPYEPLRRTRRSTIKRHTIMPKYGIPIQITVRLTRGPQPGGSRQSCIRRILSTQGHDSEAVSSCTTPFRTFAFIWVANRVQIRCVPGRAGSRSDEWRFVPASLPSSGVPTRSPAFGISS